jgi:selenium metabolism protein YedF
MKNRIITGENMIELNMTGKPCPIPVIETKKALRDAMPGDVVSILVDNDIARQNLQKMAEGMGHGFSCEQRGDGSILVAVSVSDGCAIPDAGGGLVVAIGRDVMGGPSEELGKSLMKGFIYSLTELDTPPEHVLFFNGGVFLTTEGSPALDDLAALAAKGTVINSCGACLNYHGLTEKLAIGGVTNMFSILSTMSEGKKLINL